MDDVGPIEHGPRFVPGEQHGDPFRDARPDQVAGGRASAIVQQPMRPHHRSAAIQQLWVVNIARSRVGSANERQITVLIDVGEAPCANWLTSRCTAAMRRAASPRANTTFVSESRDRDWSQTTHYKTSSIPSAPIGIALALQCSEGVFRIAPAHPLKPQWPSARRVWNSNIGPSLRGKKMPLFRHPYLVRGVVHTVRGAYVISRGLLEVPDDVAALFGWIPAGLNDDGQVGPSRSGSRGTVAERLPDSVIGR